MNNIKINIDELDGMSSELQETEMMADVRSAKVDNASSTSIDTNDIEFNFDDLSGKSSKSHENEGIPSDVSAVEDNAPTTNNNLYLITVNNKKAPIIMLFGPRSSGKTMTLIRLFKYLRDNGYTVKVERDFRSDENYTDKCDQFEKHLDTTTPLPGTSFTDFLLVEVIKHGRTVCQFLEAPGEHYFDPKNLSAKSFPPYMTNIIRKLNNRKIWVFLTEAEWDVNKNMKRSYVTRISNCKSQLVKPMDRCIILYNKVDRKEELFYNGQMYRSAAESYMREEYSGIERIFKNSNPVTQLWRSHDYKFVPFCTGYYDKDTGIYTESEDMYPRLLWKELMKCIKG